MSGIPGVALSTHDLARLGYSIHREYQRLLGGEYLRSWEFLQGDEVQALVEDVTFFANNPELGPPEEVALQKDYLLCAVVHALTPKT